MIHKIQTPITINGKRYTGDPRRRRHGVTLPPLAALQRQRNQEEQEEGRESQREEDGQDTKSKWLAKQEEGLYKGAVRGAAAAKEIEADQARRRSGEEEEGRQRSQGDDDDNEKDKLSGESSRQATWQEQGRR